MRSTKLFFAGYNGFGQFQNCTDLMTSTLTGWTVKELEDLPIDNNLIKFASSWSVNALAVSNILYLSGCLGGHFSQTKTVPFSSNIKAISCNDKFCLTVLDAGTCFKFVFSTGELSELKFTCVDRPLNKPSIFGNVSGEGTSNDDNSNIERIEHISCGETFSVAVTSTNVVYNIPTKVYTFPKHVKVKKICCGAEHALLLTGNGDVYAWGSSARGQLGIGQLGNEVIPTLINELAGIKIVDISSGLWHSGAVSVFGDLYMWGWNVNGQMGKVMYKNVKVNFESGRSEMVRHKEASVFATPEIIDLPIPKAGSDDDFEVDQQNQLENQFCVERVCCGSRHTMLTTKCGKVLGCGFNRYGQLGISEMADDDNTNIDKFTDISHQLPNPVDVRCGSWCTIFIVQDDNKSST